MEKEKSIEYCIHGEHDFDIYIHLAGNVHNEFKVVKMCKKCPLNIIGDWKD